MEFRPRQGSGQHGVRVSLDKYNVRLLLEKDLLHAFEDLFRLLAVPPGADIEVVFRLREFQVFEEDPVYLVRIVLAGMEGELGDVPGVRICV